MSGYLNSIENWQSSQEISKHYRSTCKRLERRSILQNDFIWNLFCRSRLTLSFVNVKRLLTRLLYYKTDDIKHFIPLPYVFTYSVQYALLHPYNTPCDSSFVGHKAACLLSAPAGYLPLSRRQYTQIFFLLKQFLPYRSSMNCGKSPGVHVR